MKKPIYTCDFTNPLSHSLARENKLWDFCGIP
ncbi:hypothetical protein SAMN05216348_10312 [Olsenella sp. KH3B4]|nr:hypothetical protein SAMN05216348_10312 [Olsenella sp. KH3B4]